jgi:hypothetical protein
MIYQPMIAKSQIQAARHTVIIDLTGWRARRLWRVNRVEGYSFDLKKEIVGVT